MFSLNLSKGNSSPDGEETWPRNQSLRSFFYNRTRRAGETLNSPTSIPRNLNGGSPMRDRIVGETSKSDQSCDDKMPIVVKSPTSITRILDEGSPMRDRYERSPDLNKEELKMEWKGLGDDVEDPHLIVWPPMVIVQNTRSRRGEDGKWVGIKKLELLNCFKDYNIGEVKNSYGPTGHCGVSLLIFPSTSLGYLEADFLHRKFIKEGRGKNEWENRRRRHKHSGGDILLYGYVATQGDMDLFYKHTKGKRQKFEMKSYKMMVVDPFKKMEDNDQKLIQLERKVAMGTEENKILTETRDVIRQKLGSLEREIEIIRRRANQEFNKYKLEIASLDNHYADTIKQMAVATPVT